MLTLLTCKLCWYAWTPRTEEPKRCPRCQTRDWKGGK